MHLPDRRRDDRRRTGRHRAAPAAAAGRPAWLARLRSGGNTRGLVLVPAAAAALGLATVLVLDGPGGAPSPQVPPVETVRDQAASVPAPGGVGPHGAPGSATGGDGPTTGPTTGPTMGPTGEPGSVETSATVRPTASATSAPTATSSATPAPTATPTTPSETPPEPDPAEPSPTDLVKPGKGIRPTQAPIPTKPPKP